VCAPSGSTLCNGAICERGVGGGPVVARGGHWAEGTAQSSQEGLHSVELARRLTHRPPHCFAGAGGPGQVCADGRTCCAKGDITCGGRWARGGCAADAGLVWRCGAASGRAIVAISNNGPALAHGALSRPAAPQPWPRPCLPPPRRCCPSGNQCARNT
jgi:hypothetical protein